MISNRACIFYMSRPPFAYTPIDRGKKKRLSESSYRYISRVFAKEIGLGRSSFLRSCVTCRIYDRRLSEFHRKLGVRSQVATVSVGPIGDVIKPANIRAIVTNGTPYFVFTVYNIPEAIACDREKNSQR